MKKEKLLYIHIPFCKQKCFYCDFPSYSHIDHLRKEYLQMLKKESELRGIDEYESLFIGGGTPSYLNIEELEYLGEILNNIKFSENAEKTMECNPGTIDEDKLKKIKEVGINRISFGLQTTNNNLLKKIGRIHTIEEFKENFNLARKVGFENINIDLMFGLPNQNISDVCETLEEIIRLNPEHISFYSLIIEEDTPFYKMHEKGLLNLPGEEEEREMYTEGKKILEANGYKQYEFSNYSKEGYECIHNEGYWKLKEYLGIGSSASSFLENKRIKNNANVKAYIEGMKRNGEAIEEIIENEDKENMEEYLFLGLRMIDGINKNEFKEKFGADIKEFYKEEIISNIKKGLLGETKDKIFLTDEGIEVSNYVLSDFIK